MLYLASEALGMNRAVKGRIVPCGALPSEPVAAFTYLDEVCDEFTASEFTTLDMRWEQWCSPYQRQSPSLRSPMGVRKEQPSIT